MQDAQDSGFSQREQSPELGAARVYYSAPPGGTANLSQARSPATGQPGRPATEPTPWWSWASCISKAVGLKTHISCLIQSSPPLQSVKFSTLGT